MLQRTQGITSPPWIIECKYYSWWSLLFHIQINICAPTFMWAVLCLLTPTIYITSGPWEPTSCMSSHIKTQLPTTVSIPFWALGWISISSRLQLYYKGAETDKQADGVRNTFLCCKECKKLVWHSLIQPAKPLVAQKCLPSSVSNSRCSSDPHLCHQRQNQA